MLSKARVTVQRVKALSAEQAQRLPQPEVFELYRDFQDAMLGVTEVSYEEISKGQDTSEAAFGRFFSLHRLEGMLDKEMQERGHSLAARLSPAQLAAIESDMFRKYPAYAAYTRRANLSSVVSTLLPLRQQIIEAYEKTRVLPATQDARLLEPVRKLKGVRAASYENGRFTVVLDEAIHAGGVLELTASRKPDGELAWKCSGSQMPQEVLPKTCQN